MTILVGCSGWSYDDWVGAFYPVELAFTLASIGDAIIATDIEGKITFMNTVAEELTGWTLDEASQKPANAVFNIINEFTRQKVDDPITKVLENGAIVGLANQTILMNAKLNRKDAADIIKNFNKIKDPGFEWVEG